MSEKNWFQRTPNWIWWSLVPGFGSLAIAYAGQKSNTKSWIAVGIGMMAIFVVMANLAVPDIFITLVWMAHVGTAFALKRPFLVKTYPKNYPLPENPELAKLVAQHRPKIDVNNCTKDDLVYGAGLPLAYANDIELLRNEGHIFSSSEELASLVEIPQHIIQRAEPILVFGYYIQNEPEFSWRCLNTESVEELVTRGLETHVAQQIVAERQQNGEYKSVADVRRRTGLPLKAYQMVLY